MSGAAAIPTKAVRWINPDGPINITGVLSGQTGNAGLPIFNAGYGPLMITSVTVTGDPSLTPTNLCTTLVVTTTARTAAVVHQVTAWLGPSSGFGNGRRGGNGGNAAARVSVAAAAEMLLARCWRD